MTDLLRDQLQASLGAAYTLGRELGGGAMSRVFVAHDETLGRDIVVKVLSSELSAGLSADRFAREIRLSATLQEPHIVPLHVAAMTAEGLPYYTMPFVRGESLRARLDAGPVSRDEAIAILRDIATALEYAHANGVVHRDIKPENVLLSGRTAVVTDFGIAKALQVSTTQDPRTTFTQQGMSLGTPAYMSPEQASADPNVDQRADLYAWGVIAYELLAGRHPFAGRTTAQQMIAAHLGEVPESLTASHFHVPPALATLVMQCLAKNADHRPVSASVLLSVLSDHPSASRAPGSWRAARWWLVAAAVLVAGVVVAVIMKPTGVIATPDTLSTVAVLPFENTGGDPKDEYFSEGMTDELAHALSRLPTLHVAARTSSYLFKGKRVRAEEIGKTLRVRAVVSGTVRRAGNRLRVAVELVRTSDGQQIWSDDFESSVTDVFEVQDQFTRAIVTALAPTLSGQVATSAAGMSRGTRSREAYDLYLEGRYFWNKRTDDGLQRAVSYFTKAIAQDSTYALAYAGLADSYAVMAAFNYVVPKGAYALAKPAALRALALDSTLAEAHTSLGFIHLFYDLDPSSAKRELARAIALDPRYGTAHLFMAWCEVVNGDTNAAVREAWAAQRLEPLSRIFNTRVATMLQFARRYDDAVRQSRATLEIDSTFAPAYNDLAFGQAMRGDYTEAIASARRGVALGFKEARAILGFSLARAGSRVEAARIAHQLESESPTRFVAPSDIALVHVGLGEAKLALAWLAKSYDARDFETQLMALDPMYDTMHGDPGFAALTRRR